MTSPTPAATNPVATDLTAADPADLLATDRQLGWMISVCGPPLMVGMTLPVLAQATDFAPWWNVAGVGLAVGVVTGALAGRVLPLPLLRGWWIFAPLLGMALFATSFLAFDGADPAGVVPWIWTFEAVLVTYQVLWLPGWVAGAVAACSGLLPALSGWLVFGAVPAAVAAQTPAHVSNVVFIALFVGMRGRLRRLKAAERHTRQLDDTRMRAGADARHRHRLATVVHDDVLATLTAAAAFTDRPPAALRAEAAHALAMLDVAPPAQADCPERPVEAAAALDRLLTHLRAIDPHCSISARADPGTLPAAVPAAMVGAAAQAFSNSVRHAGPDATRRVRAEFAPHRVWVEIADDGCGFDPATVDPGRLGLRTSVVGRMNSVPGSAARIDAAPGRGVRVTLTWQI